MSKLQDQLRAIGVSNPHNCTKPGHPMITYAPAQPRSCQPSHWSLTVIGRAFKNRAWYENGSIFYTCNSKNKKEVLENVFAVVKRLFPDIEMVKCPFGDYVPKCDLDELIAKAKEHASKTDKSNRGEGTDGAPN